MLLCLSAEVCQERVFIEIRALTLNINFAIALEIPRLFFGCFTNLERLSETCFEIVMEGTLQIGTENK